MLRSENILLALIQSSHHREKSKELEIALVQLQVRSHKEENRLKTKSEKEAGSNGCSYPASRPAASPTPACCPSSQKLPLPEGALGQNITCYTAACQLLVLL